MFPTIEVDGETLTATSLTLRQVHVSEPRLRMLNLGYMPWRPLKTNNPLIQKLSQHVFGPVELALLSLKS